MVILMLPVPGEWRLHRETDELDSVEQPLLPMVTAKMSRRLVADQLDL
jgi:hypothetical protein